MKIKIAYNTKDYLHNEKNHVENSLRTQSIIKYLNENFSKIKELINKSKNKKNKKNNNIELIDEKNIKPINNKTLIDLYKMTHTEEYINYIFSLSNKISGIYSLDPDTYFTSDTVEVINTNIKLLLNLTEELIENKIDVGISYIRPPGHHAEKDKAMGFCIINNVATITTYLLNHLKLNKIAIIDFDAHHGNGTENIFEYNKHVLFISSHAYPFYPFTGYNSFPEYNKFNFPLSIIANDEEILKIYQTELDKLINEFDPEFVIISMGYDIHLNDPITYMRVTNQGIDQLHKTLISKLSKYKTLWVLEGGYNLEVLQYSSLNLITNLLS